MNIYLGRKEYQYATYVIHDVDDKLCESMTPDELIDHINSHKEDFDIEYIETNYDMDKYSANFNMIELE